jgi:hypothetical protein
MPADHTAIVAAARQRHELTRAKAIKTLHELDRTGVAITFQVVAATAGVSRSWLYAQPDIRAKIQQLRAATHTASTPPIPAAQRATPGSLRRQVEVARETLRLLREENARLRRQLEQALGDRRRGSTPASWNPDEEAPF